MITEARRRKNSKSQPRRAGRRLAGVIIDREEGGANGDVSNSDGGGNVGPDSGYERGGDATPQPQPGGKRNLSMRSPPRGRQIEGLANRKQQDTSGSPSGGHYVHRKQNGPTEERSRTSTIRDRRRPTRNRGDSLDGREGITAATTTGATLAGATGTPTAAHAATMAGQSACGGTWARVVPKTSATVA